jgi:hypothetical protein
MKSSKDIINLNDISRYNSYLSISIFTIFLFMDILAYISGCKITNKRQGYLTKSFAKDSIFLINLPTLAIVVFSFSFINNLNNIEYYKSVHLPIAVFAVDSQISAKKEIIESFIHGINSGILMTTIIFSQILYLFIKIKWDYIEKR